MRRPSPDAASAADPAELTVHAALEHIRDRRLSPVALVERLLSRIAELEPQLRAWVMVDRDGALLAAREREAEIERGELPRPLHGVPVGVKDIFDVAGLPTTACSDVLRGRMAVADSAVVARLRTAGAIVLGKTVTTEFAHADPAPTRNAWRSDATPGGSSAGSAVAVAARMCPAAIGSQTGGSTLRPASYNGVVGYKPSFGLVPLDGMIPVSWSLDTVGIVTRCVDDAALLLAVLAGGAGGASHPPTRRPLRIGAVRDGFIDRAEPEMRAHANDVLERLARAGAEIRPVALGVDLAAADAAHTTIDRVELATFHRPTFARAADRYGPRIRRNIEDGLRIAATTYVEAQRLHAVVRRASASWTDQVDVLLTPATPATAPLDLSTTGDSSFQRLWTFCGLPTISLPTALGSNGLPLAIQLIGARSGDGPLLAAARWCEQTVGVALRPPDPLWIS